jgi:hypothetical protein
MYLSYLHIQFDLHIIYMESFPVFKNHLSPIPWLSAYQQLIILLFDTLMHSLTVYVNFWEEREPRAPLCLLLCFSFFSSLHSSLRAGNGDIFL